MTQSSKPGSAPRVGPDQLRDSREDLLERLELQARPARPRRGRDLARQRDECRRVSLRVLDEPRPLRVGLGERLRDLAPGLPERPLGLDERLVPARSSGPPRPRRCRGRRRGRRPERGRRGASGRPGRVRSPSARARAGAPRGPSARPRPAPPCRSRRSASAPPPRRGRRGRGPGTPARRGRRRTGRARGRRPGSGRRP